MPRPEVEVELPLLWAAAARLPGSTRRPRLAYEVPRGGSSSRSSTSRVNSALTSSPSTAQKFERGLERGTDGVTTRTLMASAYPMPGLYSKFFDVDMDPLVQAVRDTVGRHDTFCPPLRRRR